MVDADLGITFLPEMAEGSAILRNTRVRLYPIGERSHRSIGLAWRKGSGRVEEKAREGDSTGGVRVAHDLPSLRTSAIRSWSALTERDRLRRAIRASQATLAADMVVR